MPRISYAQNAEDIVLSRLFPPEYKGFYIDAGANHPVINNVTKLFYDMGWHGINIEPLAHLHKLLVEQRPRDINLHAGVGDQSTQMKFFRVNDHSPNQTGERSHFDPAGADAQRKLGWDVTPDMVQVMTLKEICEKYVTTQIDFLKIDVEGFERQTIIGADLRKFRPRCIVIEDGQWGDKRARFHWSHLLEEQDYKQILHDGVNVFFIDKDDAEATQKLQYPANTTDDYTPMRYYHMVADYQATLEEVGPNALQTIRAWARWVRKSPILASLGKTFLGK